MKKYAKTHEWIEQITEDEISLGISEYAQSQLGDLVFVSLPDVGDSFKKGESIANVESVKAVSDIYTPVSGVVSAINEVLLDEPGKINQDALNTWLVKVVVEEEAESLLSEEEYLASLD